MADPEIYARDEDGTGSMHICSKGDPDAVRYVPMDAVLKILMAARMGEIDTDLRSIIHRVEGI